MARIEKQAWKPRGGICLSSRAIAAWSLCLALFVGLTSPAFAVGIASDHTSDYLLVGLGNQNDIGTAVAVSNFELGANSVSVPMSGLAGSVPSLPGNAQTVFVGVGGNGDVAVTHSNGNFDMSNVDIFGDTGIDCTGGLGNCDTGNSNSEFNGSALNNANGLNGNVDLSGVTGELAAAQSEIPSFVGDHALSLSFGDGKWGDGDNVVINLALGITVIDIDTHENDLTLTNSNLLFDGPEGAFAIVRISDEANFLVSQSNIVVGDGGIGLNNVLFYTDKGDNNQHININNAIINGIAFWDLGNSGGEITFNNVQGCTQAIADKINLNDVRLNNCGAAIPEPGTGLLVAVGLGVLGTAGRTGMRRAS